MQLEMSKRWQGLALARLVIAGILIALGLALAVPAVADSCDAGCFPLGPGSAEFNGCKSSCLASLGGSSSGPTAEPTDVPPPMSSNDLSVAFANRNYQVVCNEVGQEPTPHGIWAANSVLLTEQTGAQLNYSQMQLAIGYAIVNHCPQYTDIYNSYRARYP